MNRKKTILILSICATLFLCLTAYGVWYANNSKEMLKPVVTATEDPKGNENIIASKPKTVSNADNSSTSADNDSVKVKKDENKKVIAIFHDMPIDPKYRNIDYFSLTDENEDKKMMQSIFEQQFNLYSNGKHLGSSMGKIIEGGYEGEFFVSFEGAKSYEVALSMDYDPYPRKQTVIKKDFPQAFLEGGKALNAVNDEFNVNVKVLKVIQADLDGDGKDEYLAELIDAEKYFYAKCLFNYDFDIVAYPCKIQEKPIEWLFDTPEEFSQQCNYYELENSTEIIDLNNDGIMEMIIDQPTYEGMEFETFTFNKGEYNANRINERFFTP